MPERPEAIPISKDWADRSAGYIIMLYPSCIIISHFGPGKWLPTCEVSRWTSSNLNMALTSS